jgi:AcrR family transcriptional regulator
MVINHSDVGDAQALLIQDVGSTILNEEFFRLKDDMPTREKLLYASAHVFAGRDFYSTKLEDIAEYAHLAKGTIYLYFKDKTDLIVSSIEYFDSKFLELIKSKLIGINSPMMRFKIALQLWLTIYSHCMSGSRGIHSYLHALPEEHRQKFINIRKSHVQFIKELLNNIADRVGKGSLKRSTELLAEVVVDAMIGYSVRVDGSDFFIENPPEKYAHFLVDVVLPHHEWMQEKV